MVILSRLGDLLALLGFLAGVWLWRGLDASRKLLAAFLGTSAACGIGQVILKAHGLGTGWMGNLWDLAVLALLVPSLMGTMRMHFKGAIRPLVFVAIGVWALFNVGMGRIPEFAEWLSLGFYSVLAIGSGLMLSQFVDDTEDLIHKAAFIRALACLSAALFDVLATLLLTRPDAVPYEMLVGAMIVRNAVWCGAYALLAYSLFLGRGYREPKRELHSGGDDLQFNRKPPGLEQRAFIGSGGNPHPAL